MVALSALEGVVSAVPARPYVVANTCPNDPGFTQQWGIFTADCNAGDPEYSHIGVTEAWDYTVGDSNMIVAVVDVGVKGSHEDFQIEGAGSKVIGDATYAGNHGTRVAGVIGASTNTSEPRGLSGVNWKTRILAKDANDGPGHIDPATAMTKTVEAVDAGAAVINHSWGGYGSPTGNDARIVNYAYRNDVVTVVAKGNDNTNEPMWPAAHPAAICVGAYRSDGIKATFSNYGSDLDLMAPGQNIQLLDTDPADPYAVSNGTSYAAPYVAGAASLLRSYMPSLSNDDVKSILDLSAEDDPFTPGWDELYGHGLLRIDSAFRMLQLPNKLRQLTATSTPYVHSVSGTYGCPFYDPVGLATGVYLVKRYEVWADVTFPSSYHSLAGVWGRGSASTGFSADAPNFAIGFVEFVPGTVTSSGGTARTYVYELWDLGGSYVGFRPCGPADIAIKYSALGEELLVTPTLSGTVQTAGHNRITWSDAIDFEANWHVDRKEGIGSWQTDYAVLPENSTSFTDSTDGLIGSELYEYRIYPSTVNQTGSSSNVVSLRAKPKAPGCISGYVVRYNEFAIDPTGYCSVYNTSECGEFEGGGLLGGESLGGGVITLLGDGGGIPPDPGELCQKTNMLVVEWQEPENQLLGAIQGYSVAWIDNSLPEPDFVFEDPTTNLADTLCSELSSQLFRLSVVTIDEYGDTSEVTPFTYLTTGAIDYCGGIGDPQQKAVAHPAIEAGLLPSSFALHQNHPNPFNAGTVIEFDLPVPSEVDLEIFDVTGRRVSGLVQGLMPAGRHACNWDGRGSNGRTVASGMYFYRIRTEGFTETKKLVVLK